jgi:hypothetical protein
MGTCAAGAGANAQADTTRSAPEAEALGCATCNPRHIGKVKEARHATLSAGSPDDSGTGAGSGPSRGDGRVRQDGTWKVGDGSFCQLLALENGGQARPYAVRPAEAGPLG